MSSVEFRLSTFVRLEVVDEDEVLAYLREVVEAATSAAEPFLEVAFVLVDEAEDPRAEPGASRFTTRATFVPGAGGWRRTDVAVPA